MSLGSAYALGHEDREIDRLQFQSRIFEPVTRRLIRECGIERGMHVLDIGCTTGYSSAVLEYKNALAKYFPGEAPDYVSLEGYIDAMIFAHALEMAGSNLTTDSLIATLESIHNLDLGIGAPISFGPSDHEGSHKVWGTVLDAKGQYQILDLD